MTDLITPEFLILLPVLAITACISGFMAGLFGIGGGAIIVPFFYQALAFLDVDPAVRMHIAVGTSLGIIVPTSIRSFMTHRAAGAVDEVLLKKWVIPITVGVVGAATLAAFLSSGGLRLVFAGIATLVGLRLIFNKESWRLGTELPGGAPLFGVGTLIGFLSTLMGIGGGVMNNTFMTLFGRSIHQAVATSSGVGTLIAIPGALGYMVSGWNVEGLPAASLGYVNLVGVALFIPLTLLVAPYGARFAHRMEKRKLEVSFGIFMLIVAARFTYSLVG